MIPSGSELVNSLLILLLPGFFVLKIWEIFFPRTNSQKQDSFDKIATYFALTLVTYILSFPLVVKFVKNPISDPYVPALIAVIVGSLLSVILSVLIKWFDTSSCFEKPRVWLNSYLPHRSQIWHQAFHIDRMKEESLHKDSVYVKVAVYMKNGFIYSGEMESYPLEDNTQDTKDFILKGVSKMGKNDKLIRYPVSLRLLLNQRDVDVIVYQYVPKTRIEKNEKIK